ncbi:MAG: ABC transporter transmembrane domain-containing protein [[Clostridium] scindens]
MTEEKKNIETQNNADFMGDGMPAGRAQNIKGTLKRFFKDLMKQRGKIIFTFFCLAVSAVCTIITPTLIGEAINQIFDGVQKAREVGGTFTVNLATMGGIMLAILILYLLGALFNYIPQYILASVSQNLTLSLRESISGKLNRLPLRYYDTHKKGDILSRVTSDLEKVADTLQEGLTEFISAVITIIGAFAMMLFISPSLTVIALTCHNRKHGGSSSDLYKDKPLLCQKSVRAGRTKREY